PLGAPPRPPLFAYTTRFRSQAVQRCQCPGEVGHVFGRQSVLAVLARRVDLDENVERTTFGLQPAVEPLGQAEPVERVELRSRLRSEEHTSELQSRENLVCRL